MKKTILIFVVCAMLFVLVGCVNYDYLGSNEERGRTYDINGIVYRQLPETPWRPINHQEIFLGKIDHNETTGRDLKSKLYMFAFDVKKIFLVEEFDTVSIFDVIFDLDTSEPPADVYYYRDDIELPSFDSNGIDRIGVMNDNGVLFIHTVEDQSIIEEVLQVIHESDEGDMNWTSREFLYELYFMSSQYEGIGIHASIAASEGYYWILDEELRTFLIPQTLVEKIVGKSLPPASVYS